MTEVLETMRAEFVGLAAKECAVLEYVAGLPPEVRRELVDIPTDRWRWNAFWPKEDMPGCCLVGHVRQIQGQSVMDYGGDLGLVHLGMIAWEWAGEIGSEEAVRRVKRACGTVK